MQDRKCSQCGSANVYESVGINWHRDGVVIQMVAVDGFRDLLQTEAFLCLDCRHLEIQVVATSTVQGKQRRTLADTVQASNNWVKA